MTGRADPQRLSLAVLDVNETLIDVRALSDRFVAVGAPASLLTTWFAGVLRDGFAFTLLGRFSTFRELALGTLRSQLDPATLDRDPYDAAAFIVDGIAELPLHDDVADGLRALRNADLRVVTLTNGSIDVTRSVLNRAGVLDLVDELFDISATKRWKPAAEPYLDTLTKCGTPPRQAALIASHPWDVLGARAVGMVGFWLNRGGVRWPFPDESANGEADSLAGVATQLSAHVRDHDARGREPFSP